MPNLYHLALFFSCFLVLVLFCLLWTDDFTESKSKNLVLSNNELLRNILKCKKIYIFTLNSIFKSLQPQQKSKY